MVGHDVWVFLVARDVETGGGLAIYIDEDAAARAALSYITDHWPDLPESVPTDAFEAIDAYNALNGDNEVVTVAGWPVLPGELSSEPLAIDRRPRCVDCGEPLELERESDAESWIHADDANYFGDHTARVN